MLFGKTEAHCYAFKKLYKVTEILFQSPYKSEIIRKIKGVPGSFKEKQGLPRDYLA